MGQPQTAGDDARVGWARRAENYPEIRAAAEAWRWDGETYWDLVHGVITGTPDLSDGARHLLLLYLRHLSDKDLQASDACVWPGSALLEEATGRNARTIRRWRAELEHRGYILRAYNRANRPAGEEAVDLAPTIVRLAELEEAFRGAMERRDERRAAWQALDAPGEQDQDVDVRPGGQICPPEQSERKRFSSVRGRAPSARPRSAEASPFEGRRLERDGPPAPPKRRRSDSAGASCSPRRASGPSGAPSRSSVAAELLQEELRLARRACPQLAALVPARVFDDPLTEQPVDAGMVARAAHQLLPEANRNNGHSAIAGWKRHGPRVVVMLAVALTDPIARDRCRYFGGFVTADGAALDLRPNLKRVLRAATAEAAPAAKPSPIWASIDAELRRLLRRGDYETWFGPGIVFKGLINGSLTVAAPDEVRAREINARFSQSLIDAASAAHIAVTRATCVVHRPGRPT